MKYHVYTRISKETAKSLSVEDQKRKCLEWIRNNTKHTHPVIKVHEERDVSGGKPLTERIELITLIDSIERGDMVIIAKRDRLARDYVEIAMIEKEITKRGARLVSVGENLGDDPESFVMKGIVDIFAEWERKKISERTKAALKYRRDKGMRTGTVPFGKKLSECGKYLVDSEEDKELVQFLRDNCEASPKDLVEMVNEAGFRNKRGTAYKYRTLAYLKAAHGLPKNKAGFKKRNDLWKYSLAARGVKKYQREIIKREKRKAREARRKSSAPPAPEN